MVGGTSLGRCRNCAVSKFCCHGCYSLQFLGSNVDSKCVTNFGTVK